MRAIAAGLAYLPQESRNVALKHYRSRRRSEERAMYYLAVGYLYFAAVLYAVLLFG